eukprot:357985-Chlamydomonas_euryale.AAC.3
MSAPNQRICRSLYSISTALHETVLNVRRFQYSRLPLIAPPLGPDTSPASGAGGKAASGPPSAYARTARRRAAVSGSDSASATRSAASYAVVRPTRSTMSSRPMIARLTATSVSSSTRIAGASGGGAAADPATPGGAAAGRENATSPERPADCGKRAAAPVALAPAAPSCCCCCTAAPPALASCALAAATAPGMRSPSTSRTIGRKSDSPCAAASAWSLGGTSSSGVASRISTMRSPNTRSSSAATSASATATIAVRRSATSRRARRHDARSSVSVSEWYPSSSARPTDSGSDWLSPRLSSPSAMYVCSGGSARKRGCSDELRTAW